MDSLWQDVRYALRGMRTRPGFTAVIIITLTLGIGVNTAMFSVVDAVLLQPFPYKDPEQIVLLWGSKKEDVRPGIAWPDLQDWRAQNRVFNDIAPFLSLGFEFDLGQNETDKTPAAFVGPGVFPLLGVQPVHGRGFLPEESTPGKEKVVVLSYAIWQSRFGGDRNLIGKSIVLSNEPFTVVGVMPPGFFFPEPGIEIWAAMPTNFLGMGKRGHPTVHAVARLKPNVPLEKAQAELDTITKRLEQAYPATNANVRAGIFSLYGSVVGEYQNALWTLLGAVSLVLLIACANVANLLLSRTVAREPEIAVRTALGASRRRIMRQLLTESLVLAVLGGAAGLLLAYWGVELIRDLGLSDIPRIEQTELNGRVLGFTLGLSLLTGLLFGSAPALRSGRVNLVDCLKLGNVPSGRTGRGQLRDLLVVAEIAIALVLLISAGLLINSFVRLATVDLGFSAENVLVIDVKFPFSKYFRQRESFYQVIEHILNRLEILPGVVTAAAGYDDVPIYRSGGGGSVFSTNGRVHNLDLSMKTNSVSPGYFKTLSIPILKGRAFTREDNRSAPKVVVVSESFAKKIWPGEDALGKQIDLLTLSKELEEKNRRLGRPWTKVDPSDWNNPNMWVKWEKASRTVIGIVGDVRMKAVGAPSRPALYLEPRQASQTWGSSRLALLIRTSEDYLQHLTAIKGQILSMEPEASFREIHAMEEIVSQSMGARGSNKLLLSLSAVFGFLAVLLSVIGIYGVLSHSVSQRTHEIGVRMALGAHSRHIFGLVIGHGLRLVCYGLALGLTGAWATTRSISSFLFGVEPADLITFSAVSLLMLMTALLACYFPARRAAKINPADALRYE